MLKFYAHPKCSTCRSAAEWLRSRNTPFTEIDIRQTPPSRAELTDMLEARGGELRKLFNTSGLSYKKLGLKDKVGSMKPADAICLLTADGMLVKRPFLIGNNVHLAGFRPAEWEKSLP